MVLFGLKFQDQITNGNLLHKDKDMKMGFLQGENGGNSNSRLIADVVIIAALLFAEQVLLFRGDAGIMVAASAAGTIFLTVGGAAMAFLFAQKKQEIKRGKNENIRNGVQNK